VHFGVVMLLNLAIGLLTPPVGTTLLPCTDHDERIFPRKEYWQFES
jgi:hypothetical protein